jgi:hypothetical protein
MTIVKAGLSLLIIPFLTVAASAQSSSGADGGQTSNPPKQGNLFDGNVFKRVLPDLPVWHTQQTPPVNDAPNAREMHSGGGDHLFDEPVHVGPGSAFDRGL